MPPLTSKPVSFFTLKTIGSFRSDTGTRWLENKPLLARHIALEPKPPWTPEFHSVIMSMLQTLTKQFVNVLVGLAMLGTLLLILTR